MTFFGLASKTMYVNSNRYVPVNIIKTISILL